jgi:glutathione S-transferase
LTKTEYLVGDKCTAADLAFITWAAPTALPVILGDAYPENGFGEELPYFQAWMDRLMAREKVRKVFADQGKIVGGKI